MDRSVEVRVAFGLLAQAAEIIPVFLVAPYHIENVSCKTHIICCLVIEVAILSKKQKERKISSMLLDIQ